jgi:hypothetical protein
MKKFRILSLFTLLALPFQVFCQGEADVEMADSLRANGKIYVVVVGLAVILTGITILLIVIERKLHRLEGRENSTKK